MFSNIQIIQQKNHEKRNKWHNGMSNKHRSAESDAEKYGLKVPALRYKVAIKDKSRRKAKIFNLNIAEKFNKIL